MVNRNEHPITDTTSTQGTSTQTKLEYWEEMYGKSEEAKEEDDDLYFKKRDEKFARLKFQSPFYLIGVIPIHNHVNIKRFKQKFR